MATRFKRLFILCAFLLLASQAGAQIRPDQLENPPIPDGTFAELPSPPSEKMRFVVSDCLDSGCSDGGGSIVRELRYDGSDWVVLSGTGGSTTIDQGFDAGDGKITGANESKPFDICGESPNDDDCIRIYRGSDGVLRVVPVVGGVENDADRVGDIPSGKVWDFQINGTSVVKFTASGVENLTLNAEGTGNAITLPEEHYFEVAACQNTTATLIFNTNTANAPAPNCEGTNTRLATADFDDSTDEGFDFSWRLPTGFQPSLGIDIIIRWKAAAITGAAGWCAQLARVPTGATSDPSLPAQASGNCASTTVAGTTLQEVETTITGVTCTSCVAGDRINGRISRDANGGAVTDDMSGDGKMLGFARRWRVTK